MRKAVAIGLLALFLAGTWHPPARAQEKIDINFAGTELEKVLEWVAKLTKKRFIYDEKLKKRKIYVVSPVEVPADKVFDIFQSILQVNKFILVKKLDGPAEFYQVSELLEATKNAVPTFGESDRSQIKPDDMMATQVIPLKYADPRTVQTALQPLVSDPKGIVVIEDVGAVIVTDYSYNLLRIGKVIDLMDREKPGILTEVVALQYASAADVETKLTKILAAMSQVQKRPGAPAVPDVLQMVADPRTNKLIVVASETRLRQILGLVAEMDVQLPAEPRLVHVRPLKHAQAKTLAENLNKIYGVVGQAKAAAAPAAAAAAGAPGGAPPVGSGLPGPATLTASIVADEANNALVIVADAATYQELEETIAALDIRRPQVLIEGAVVEVSGDRSLDLGVELASTDGPGSKMRGFGGSAFGLSTLADTDGDALPDVKVPFRVDPATGALAENSGLTFGLMRGPNVPNVGMVVNMLKSTRDANVLQLPQVTTNDNVGATLRVTESAPTVSFIQTQAGNNVQTFNNFQEAGITLNITPHISEAEYLRLEISQKIEQFEGVQTNPAVPPPKTTREIVNIVTIPNGRTAVIGGLVRDVSREQVSKIPFLGEIPILGEFFKRTTRTSAKSTLYLFVLPKILKDPNFEDYMAETERRSREMEERTLGKWRGVKDEVKGEGRSLETIEYRSPFSQPTEEVDLPAKSPIEGGGEGENK